MGIRVNDFDDDAYYADLEKWILKLTDDDDKEDCAVALGADGCRYGITGSVGVNRGLELACVPCWGSLKKGGNLGTGVFIPQINNPGKVVAKNEKGRVRSSRHKGKEQIGGHKVKISTPLDRSQPIADFEIEYRNRRRECCAMMSASCSVISDV